MLEDRIIVQDRGIDAGLAALIQNANKGNMDPAALMAMMNNGGFGGNGRRRLNTISGIPVLKTTGVVATSTEVRYDVNYQEYRSLPNEGLFFLDVRQSSAEASASLPVGLSDGNSENNNQSMLRNALQEDVQAGDLQLNFRYLIYYNKCNNVYQLVNAYPANITAPGA